MEPKFEQVTASPPRLIPSLGAGFNAVANNVSLILLPIVVDLLLWLGPHVRLRNLLGSAYHAWNERTLAALASLGSPVPPEVMEALHQSELSWNLIFEKFNFLGVLRTWPVGVPSLVSFRQVVASPLDRMAEYEVPTFLMAAGIWLLLIVFGIFLGTFYFNAVARFSGDQPVPFSVHLLVGQFVQTLLLTLILALVLVIISVPLVIVLGIAALINTGLVQVVVFGMTFLLLWLLLPLFFSPHGIFMRQSGARDAVFQSMRLSRLFAPGTGLMVLLIVVIGQGMNIIWLLPKWDSWMVLVGITGHAFISSGLLAATFVYYGQGLDWLEERARKNGAQPQPGGIL